MSAIDAPPSNRAPLLFVLDRVVDGEWAVLESDGAGGEPPIVLTLPMGWLPAGVREGDVLRVETVAGARDAQVTLVRDDEARAARAARLDALRRAIPRGPSGDITL